MDWNVDKKKLSWGKSLNRIDIKETNRCLDEPYKTLLESCFTENPALRPTVRELIRDKSPELKIEVEKILRCNEFKMDFIEC